MRIGKWAVYIGRFQPFHNGHLDAIKQIYDDGVGSLIIGVGSMQEKGTEKNPFSFEERIEMIQAGVEKENFDDMSISYMPIPDFNQNESWFRYIQRLALHTFEVVYTSNDWTAKAFQDGSKNRIKTKTLDLNLDISATKVRYEMSSQDSSWKQKVPKGTLDYLIKIEGDKKVRDILSSNNKERLAADLIIEKNNKLVLIDRLYPPYGLALPGGMKEINESIEETASREGNEEVGLEIKDLKLFGVYSKPGRDPRGPVTSVVFTAKGEGEIRVGSDAKNYVEIPIGELLKREYAFDHKQIIKDYLEVRG